MGFLDKYIAKRVDALGLAEKVTTEVTTSVVKHVDSALSKSADITPLGTPGLKRYEFIQGNVNGHLQTRKKPGTNISFESLRRFSIAHEVSRACINYRKRQITGLDWDIVTADESQTEVDKTKQRELREFFKTLGGRGNGYRRFMDKFVEDIMVLDAVSLEKQRTRGGALLNLIPVDAATIRLMVDNSGATPEPPEIAYKQVIRGTVTAELTADEMIYEMMNPRNDSPYGLAPLESLIVVVTSSLKAGMYNLAYLTDGNVPEGLYTLPETWQPQQIKEFQEYFDALMAGNESMTRRLKFMPQGDYMPTKKPEDMAFQEFNDWLMKITCALFDVSPQDIGFSPKTGLGGKGYAEQQDRTSEKKGLAPLANFIEEIFTHIIQEELGYTDLKFQYTGLIEHDAKSVAQTNEILIRSGQRTINELRTDEGLTPIPGLDKPLFAGTIQFIDEGSQNESKSEGVVLGESQGKTAAPEEGRGGDSDKATEDKASKAQDGTFRDRERRDVALVTELRTFRKYALGRIKAGKTMRPFVSEVLPESVTNELNEKLTKVSDVDQARVIINEYMQDYNVDFMSSVAKLRSQLSEVV